MEQATLRPVPLRPAGPVDPAEAAAHVAGFLPDLDPNAARALGLVEIAGRTRDEASEQTGLAPDPLAEALYRARKALRRSIFPLSASGWCERAERLLSDRLDGVLKPPGPARLDVHLRNCERCIEHERRLSQARERLVREFIDAHPEVDPVSAGRARAAGLRVVEPAIAIDELPAEPTGPVRIVAGFGGVIVEPLADDADDLPQPSFAGPGGQAEYAPIEARPAVAEAEDELPADPPVEETVAPAEPADATPSESGAENADPLVEPGEPEADVGPEDAIEIDWVAPAPVAPEPVVEPEAVAPVAIRTAGARLLWNGLLVLAVGLAVFAIVITLMAIAGTERIF